MNSSVPDAILFEMVFEHEAQFSLDITFIHLKIGFIYISNCLHEISSGVTIES